MKHNFPCLLGITITLSIGIYFKTPVPYKQTGVESIEIN